MKVLQQLCSIDLRDGLSFTPVTAGFRLDLRRLYLSLNVARHV